MQGGVTCAQSKRKSARDWMHQFVSRWQKVIRARSQQLIIIAVAAGVCCYSTVCAKQRAAALYWGCLGRGSGGRRGRGGVRLADRRLWRRLAAGGLLLGGGGALCLRPVKEEDDCGNVVCAGLALQPQLVSLCHQRPRRIVRLRVLGHLRAGQRRRAAVRPFQVRAAQAAAAAWVWKGRGPRSGARTSDAHACTAITRCTPSALHSQSLPPWRWTQTPTRHRWPAPQTRDPAPVASQSPRGQGSRQCPPRLRHTDGVGGAACGRGMSGNAGGRKSGAVRHWRSSTRPAAPALHPPASQMLRVKAVPGNMPAGDQRRGGSPSQLASLVQHGRPGSFSPSSWSSVSTRAPALITR